MIERWGFIPDVPHIYMVSNRGRVYSIRSQSILTPTKSGYVVFYIDKEPVSFKVENLVRAAFGFACGVCDCDSAMNCWRCGFNPAVDEERKRLLRENGLTVENGIGTFYLDKTILEAGWSNMKNLYKTEGPAKHDWE